MAQHGRSFPVRRPTFRRVYQYVTPTLIVDDVSHAHTVDSILFGATLVVDDLSHGHTADAASPLTQTHNLTVTDLAHAHAAESPVLTQDHNLAVAESFHGHTIDSPLLSIPTPVAGKWKKSGFSSN